MTRSSKIRFAVPLVFGSAVGLAAVVLAFEGALLWAFIYLLFSAGFLATAWQEWLVATSI